MPARYSNITIPKSTFKIAKKCETCGLWFETLRSNIRRGKGRFCSRGCRAIGMTGVPCKRGDDVQRFWNKVIKGPGCWEWTGRLYDESGYGEFYFNGRGHGAHRIAWTFTYGKIPDGLYILHKCDNRKCVNPEHLFMGTQLDNITDMRSKGRAADQKQTCRHNSKLTDNQVLEIKKELAGGSGLLRLATAYNVDITNISKIRVGKIWRDIPWPSQ